MKENNFTVYCHKNKINGKRYVGVTHQEPHSRWRNGGGYRTQTKFYNAIQKYGWDNFEHIIIAEGLSQQEAYDIEINLIKQWHTQDNEYGYNVTQGGDLGRLGIPMSDEAKVKISQSLKGRFVGEKSPCYGITLSEEHRRKISEAGKGRKCSDETRKKLSLSKQGKKNPMYGVHLTGAQSGMYGKHHTPETIEKIRQSALQYRHSDESKKKISESHKGSGNPMYGKCSAEAPSSVPVYCLELSQRFNCAMDAKREYGIDNSRIIKCCRGRAKSAGKHPITKEPLYWMYYEDYIATQDGDNNII